jgi:proline dehydrogenase
MISFENTNVAFASKTDKALRKTYFLFKVMAFPLLVDWGAKLLQFALKLKLPVKGLIKQTFFAQFCGGESISDCQSCITALGEYNVKTILDYSVEGKKSEKDLDKCAAELIRTTERAKGDPLIPFSVFKITGIARFSLLEKVNNNEPLSTLEQEQFENVKRRVNEICKAAYDAKTPVFIDAEESWIQDAIDALALEMMMKYNKEVVMVFNTAQLYRHDRYAYLERLLETAKAKEFKVGIKLVRGAYMEKERERAKALAYPSPIQANKAKTDHDFDNALRLLVNHIDYVALCCGSHNESSNLLLTQLMKEKGIAPGDERIYFAQLLGMSDHISYNLSKAGYNVAKYVPYGPVNDVMPYLIRRAEENTSIAGQTSRELSLIEKEVRRRKMN